jgi:hypothetical protein
MKTFRAAPILFFVFCSSTALAANCDGNPVIGAALSTYLNDNLICAYDVGTGGTDPNTRWSEWHKTSGGTLTEYARGPGHAVDPTKDIGTWSIASDEVMYNYDGGSNYTWQIYDNAGTTGLYQFCTLDATPVQKAIVKVKVSSPLGANPCAWSN